MLSHATLSIVFGICMLVCKHNFMNLQIEISTFQKLYEHMKLMGNNCSI